MMHNPATGFVATLVCLYMNSTLVIDPLAPRMMILDHMAAAQWLTGLSLYETRSIATSLLDEPWKPGIPPRTIKKLPEQTRSIMQRLRISTTRPKPALLM